MELCSHIRFSSVQADTSAPPSCTSGVAVAVRNPLRGDLWLCTSLMASLRLEGVLKGLSVGKGGEHEVRLKDTQHMPCYVDEAMLRHNPGCIND